jgi:hypothetical protein
VNTYQASDGTRYTQSQIERKIREAKQNVLDKQLLESGYNYCVDCKSNGMNTYLDCSHTLSVDKCKKDGCVELSWCESNIRIRCRRCHSILDGLN